MAYARGDIVLVPFPFTDLSATRVRPGVVVSSEEFNANGDVIVAMVTSRARTSATDCVLSDWKAAGLVHRSWARAKLATLAQHLVQFSPGRLTARDMKAVGQRLRAALRL
jgi:mRNA interferase MazF